MSKETKNGLGGLIAGIVLSSLIWLIYCGLILPDRCYREFYGQLRRDYEFTPKSAEVADVKWLDEEYSPDGPPKPNVRGIFIRRK